MQRIATSLVQDDNAARLAAVGEDYDALATRLRRRGIDVDAIRERVGRFGVAVPSWGVGTGGTRFARFPGLGEPRHVFEKIEDCGVIHQLTRATPSVSLHIPWDRCDDWSELRAAAASLQLGFDAMNSNTFSDQPGQARSYKFGSLSHTDAGTRAQAVAHNLDCIEIGRKLGSRALTVWVGDGSNFRASSISGARSTATSRAPARSTPPCPPTGACSSSTRSASPRSIPP